MAENADFRLELEEFRLELEHAKNFGRTGRIFGCCLAEQRECRLSHGRIRENLGCCLAEEGQSRPNCRIACRKCLNSAEQGSLSARWWPNKGVSAEQLKQDDVLMDSRPTDDRRSTISAENQLSDEHLAEKLWSWWTFWRTVPKNGLILMIDPKFWGSDTDCKSQKQLRILGINLSSIKVRNLMIKVIN